MNRNNRHHTMPLMLPMGCALALLCGGTACTDDAWIDDVWDPGAS